MMNGLEAPPELPCVSVQGDHRTGNTFIEGPAHSPEEIGRRVSHRQIDETEILIRTDRRPAVGCRGGVGLARRRCTVILGMSHIKRPGETTGDRIVGANNTGRFAPELAVRHATPEDGLAADYLRRRGYRVIAERDVTHALFERHMSVDAKIWAWFSRGGIEGDQFRRLTRCENALGAQASGLRHSIVGNTSAGLTRWHCGARHVVPPTLAPCVGVQGNDDVVCTAEIKR